MDEFRGEYTAFSHPSGSCASCPRESGLLCGTRVEPRVLHESIPRRLQPQSCHSVGDEGASTFISVVTAGGFSFFSEGDATTAMFQLPSNLPYRSSVS